MATRIFGLSFHGMRSIATCAHALKSLPSPVNDNETKIATLGKQLLNKGSVHNTDPKKTIQLDQKKIIPFAEFVERKVEPFETYKKNVSSLLDQKNDPLENEKILKKAYKGVCLGRYKRYIRIMEGKGNPATSGFFDTDIP